MSRAALRARLASAGRTPPAPPLFTIGTQHAGYAVATTPYAGPVPTGLAVGQLVLAQLVSNSTVVDTITPPDVSWTALLGAALAGANEYSWWWHLVTAAEVATPPAAWNFGFSTARAGNIMITRITGNSTVSPINTVVSNALASGTTEVVPSVTTTVANCLLVGGGNIQSATTATVTVPTGWTQDDTTCQLSLGRGQVAGHLQLGAAGATGAQTFTLSQVLAGEGFMVAVAPA